MNDAKDVVTPGPWLARLESTRYVIQHEPEDSPGYRAIAVTAGSYPLNEANARLIAAAPDLLAALQGILDDDSQFVSLADQRRRWDDRMDAARIAIAKAQGNDR